MKNIGKPCAGKPHARFDEGGLANAAMEWLFRHRQMKRAETDKNVRGLRGPCWINLNALVCITPISK